MATETQTVNSNVEQVEVNLDEIFNAAPSGADMIQDTTAKPKSIFSGLNKKADMSFADPDLDDKDDLNAKVEAKEENTENETEVTNTPENETEVKETETKVEADVDDIFESLDPSSQETEVEVEEKKEKRGRKTISGISDVFGKLIKEDKIVPFDDDKSLEEYTAKDWEELIRENVKSAEQRKTKVKWERRRNRDRE